MFVLAATLLLAAAPVSPRAERALAAQLSTSEQTATVRARAVRSGCVVVALDVKDHVDVGADVVVARGRGQDARGRVCVVDVVVDVSWRRAAPAIATGTRLPVRVVLGAVEVEGDGVVVPCGVADRDDGFVCARVGANNVRGVVDGGVLVVTP